MDKLTALVFAAVVGGFSYVIVVRCLDLDPFWLFGMPQ